MSKIKHKECNANILSSLRPRARLARVSHEMRFLIFCLTRIGVPPQTKVPIARQNEVRKMATFWLTIRPSISEKAQQNTTCILKVCSTNLFLCKQFSSENRRWRLDTFLLCLLTLVRLIISTAQLFSRICVWKTVFQLAKKQQKAVVCLYVEISMSASLMSEQVSIVDWRR